MEKIGKSVKLWKIAVTGVTGSGKTTFCRFLKELGSEVISADAIVHDLLANDVDTKRAVITLLGQEIAPNSQIDRTKVAKKVFSCFSLLKQLEQILHPKVQQVINNSFIAAAKRGAPLFVAEVPLLFESGMEKDFDYVIAINRNQAEYQENFLERRRRQMPLKEKCQRSDQVIQNDADLDALKRSANLLFKQFALSI